VANTDFVDRIRSRLDEVDTTNLQSEMQSYYFFDLTLCTSNSILTHTAVLAWVGNGVSLSGYWHWQASV